MSFSVPCRGADCPVCNMGIPKKTSVTVQGYDMVAKQSVTLQLPLSVVDKIRAAMNAKPSRLRRILLWLAYLFGRKRPEKGELIIKTGSREIKVFLEKP
jgi:hypothetical protein